MAAPKNSHGLTPKQQKFGQEFLKDFSAARAYKRAGYKSKSPDVEAAKLLGKPSMASYLNSVLNKAEEVAQVSLAAIVREAGRIAFADPTEAMEWDDNGVRLKDSKTLPKRVTASIRSVSSTRTIVRGRDGSETETVNTRMEFHGKAQAIAFLGKFFGVGRDFNQARAALLQYGIAMVPDETAVTGFRLEPYDPGTPAIASIEAAEDSPEFASDVWEPST